MSKLLLITGASKGIGLETAKQFLRDGYKVLNISRSPCDLEFEGEEVSNLSIDLWNEDALYETLKAHEIILNDHDEIVIIHNAAALAKDSIETTKAKDLLDILKVNVVAMQVINEFMIPFMKKGSSVLYTGSTLSEMAVPGAYTYVVSKHAVAGMMKATCQDLAGKGIHTALICPGFTDTEMLHKHLNHDQEILKAVASGNSYGRLIEPKEIADMFFFAAKNPVINGSILHGNLGQLNR